MLLFYKQIYTNLVLLNTVAEEIILNQFNKTNQYVFSANYLQNYFLNDFTNRYFLYMAFRYVARSRPILTSDNHQRKIR